MPDFHKKNAEIFPVSVDFVNVLDTGETIILGNSGVTAVDEAGDDATATVIVPGSVSVSGSQLLAKVRAGSDDESYTVTFKAGTSDSNVYELDLVMKVKN